jgi:hypothetical protein
MKRNHIFRTPTLVFVVILLATGSVLLPNSSKSTDPFSGNSRNLTDNPLKPANPIHSEVSLQVHQGDSSLPVWLSSIRLEKLVIPTRLNQAIRLSAHYLIRMCDDKGKFVYRINLNPEFAPEPEYNILRHAGTIYALAMYEQVHPDEATRDTLDRAARFLKRETLAPIPGRDDLLAVWSYPQMTGTSDPVQAELGGTSRSRPNLAGPPWVWWRC